MNLNKKIILQKEIQNVSQLKDIVAFLKPQLQDKTCFLLKGDLAAGKTTLVSEFCQSFSINQVASPTFAIHHHYENSAVQIDHFDLYRLNNAEEIETSGLWDVLAKPKCLVFIEWPERINQQDIELDFKIFEITLEKKSETIRNITIAVLN